METEKTTKTDKAIAVKVKAEVIKCGRPGCPFCGDGEYTFYTWGGEWMGKPGNRPPRRDDQILEIKKGYTRATHMDDGKICRDAMVLLTYGQIKREGMEGIMEYVRRSRTAYREKVTVEIIEWFIDTVDRNWTPPLEAEYLAQYIRQEALHRGIGIVDVFNTQKMKELIEAGIIEYEQSMFSRVKGITNDKEETRAGAKA